MGALAALRELDGTQRHTVLASFLGWTLDAFDYFLLVFLMPTIAQEFHVDITRIYLRHPADAGVPSARRAAVRAAGRPLRSSPHPDVRYRAVFGAGFCLRVCAVADGAACVARAVRHRDGRRMGHRRVAGDGVDPAAFARFRFRPAAKRLPLRLSAGRAVLRPAVGSHRLARHVHARRAAGAAGAVHAPQRAGIPGVRNGAAKAARNAGCSRPCAGTGACSST